MMNVIAKRLSSIATILAGIVTIVVSPWSNFDPVNLIKVLVLASGSFFVFGVAISKGEQFWEMFKERRLYLSLLFPLSLIATIFISNSNFSQQFWGIFGRNNGFLSYFSLYLLFITVASMCNSSVSFSVAKSMKVTNLIVFTYALIQWSGNDPIGWSQKGLFATLGNVNFASAFLALSSIAWMGVLLFNNFKSTSLLITLLLGTEFLVLMKMDSIQGPVMFIVGLFFLSFLKLRKNFKSRLFFVLSIMLTVTLSVFGFFGVLGLGPLKKFVFQNSNVFRADYMGAALKMIENKPLFGVGLDSYDNWYRTFRGFISAYRTGINRSSNSAHNIILDIGASGGIPLLLGYLLILGLSFLSFIKLIKQYRQLDSNLLVIAVAWLAYQIQSLISINQIGVGIWGWLLNGALIACSFTVQSDVGRSSASNQKIKNRVKTQQTSLPPNSLLVGIFVGILGFGLALPPISADAQFRKAMTSSDLGFLLKSDNKLGLSDFHVEKALEVITNRGMKSESMLLANRIVEKYPRSLFAWQVLYQNSQNASEKQKAFSEIQSIDPWFACLKPEPSRTIQGWFESLPDPKKIELARWWGLLPMTPHSTPDKALLASISSEALNKWFVSVCGR